MVHFVIAGIFDCTNYIHVCYVADYLQQRLPNFQVRKEPMDGYDWGNWLDTINRKNKWHHQKSPLIYKELIGFGRKPHLIGGISEFWEYCYDYYGLESVLTEEELENLKKDHLTFFGKDHILKDHAEGCMKILIYGPKTRYLWLLLGELMRINGLSKTGDFQFHLYTDNPVNEEDPVRDFEDVISYLRDEHNVEAKAWETLVEATDKGSELIIITEHFRGESDKDLNELIITMNQLADFINHGKCKKVKVVFANFGLSCFPATILAGKLDHPNVVVVTSDQGLGPLNVLSKLLHLDIRELCGPPVWGFVGHNKTIDLQSVIKKCDVFKPYNRAVKGKEDSTLVQGVVGTELRFIDYLVDDWQSVSIEIRKRKNELKDKLNRAPVYSKLRATVNLLKLWLSPNNQDEIISLGCISDGSYNIPEGMVFSQPAILENGKWVPFPDFPVRPEVQTCIDKFVEAAKQLPCI